MTYDMFQSTKCETNPSIYEIEHEYFNTSSPRRRRMNLWRPSRRQRSRSRLWRLRPAEQRLNARAPAQFANGLLGLRIDDHLVLLARARLHRDGVIVDGVVGVEGGAAGRAGVAAVAAASGVVKIFHVQDGWGRVKRLLRLLLLLGVAAAAARVVAAVVVDVVQQLHHLSLGS